MMLTEPAITSYDLLEHGNRADPSDGLDQRMNGSLTPDEELIWNLLGGFVFIAAMLVFPFYVLYVAWSSLQSRWRPRWPLRPQRPVSHVDPVTSMDHQDKEQP